MGTIYAASHPVIAKQVAIKVLAALLSQDETMTQRFIQEARAVNQIKHENIVDIFAFGRLPDGRLYYVMELLKGESLKARRKRPPSLRYDEALSILAQVCDALAAAHAQGIVHRDLKPDNVFLVEGRGLHTVKLLDFGIAKLIRRDQVDRKTEAGLLMGTPQYMSPEQCLSKEVDARTDVYSLGVIMFEMFTGRVPFAAPTAIEVINAHLQQPPPAPKELANVPHDLNDLLIACLAKEPDKRPSSIAEVRERLLEISISQALGLDAGLPAAISLAVAESASSIKSSVGSSPTPLPSTMSVPRVVKAMIAGPPGFARLPAPVRYATLAIILGFAVFGLWMAVERLRAQPSPPVAAQDQVTLQVLSEPPGAAVILDGRRQALLTPYVVQVPRARQVEVRLELPGYAAHQETVPFADEEREKAVRVVLQVIGPDAAPQKTIDAAPKRPIGSPPVIAELRLRSMVGTVGAATTIAGEVSFDDADGDVRSVAIDLRTGPGPRRPQRIRLNVGGARNGTAAFSFVFAPKAAVPHTLEAWVLDEAGNPSNHLTTTLDAQAAPSAPPPLPEGEPALDAASPPSQPPTGP
jgi:serine/threonine-protein kinase